MEQRRLQLLAWVAALGATAACAGVPRSAPESHHANADPGTARAPVSDPLEYRLEHPSREAGHAIFTRTGLGDPYRAGLAYPVFLALLRAYPEQLGGDLAGLARRFGFLARTSDPSSRDLDEREGLPVGLHLTRDPGTGVPFVVGNCTLCHAERVRWPGGERLIVGIGNRAVRVHAYDAALHDVATAPDFDRSHIGPVAAHVAREHRVPWPPEWRSALIDASLAGLRERARDRASLVARTRAGLPGRVATIESFAVAMEPVVGRTIERAEHVGWARVPDVVGFPHRATLSWDGAGEGPLEVLAVEADFAFGVRLEWFHSHPHQGASLVAYLRDLQRSVRYPASIDRALAARGRGLFDAHCADCHGSYEPTLAYRETVVPLRTIGTDPARALAVTDSFVQAANEPALSAGVLRTRRTLGYVPPVLTNVWARAPYGHAGQWPSLAVLATEPARRPVRYVVQLDAPLDLDAVGVRTRPEGAALAEGEFVYDGTQPGFSVLGHPFLADLGAADARAVIEYLRTL